MFLRNGWYAASWSKDLGTTPVARTFLDEPVVLFRGASGQAAALTDRCCHRAAPLSRGEVVGDALRCGYHGLVFDAGGQCIAALSVSGPSFRMPAEKLDELGRLCASS